MPFTKRITIERYNSTPEDVLEGGPLSLQDQYAGCIEGETDDGKRWILFVDGDGRPLVFWPDREQDGAVIGDGIDLVPDDAGLQGDYAKNFDQLVADIGDGDPTEEQYKLVRRIAYTERTVWFKQDQYVKDGPTVSVVYNRRNPSLKGEGSDVGRAYWDYRKKLARLLP